MDDSNMEDNKMGGWNTSIASLQSTEDSKATNM